MKTKWDLNQEAFSQLLAWLNSNSEQAGRKYEEIRRQLIKIFTCRGCTCPEDLVDETINRVAKRVGEIAATYVGDCSLFFYGVARNVYLEYVRKRPVPAAPPVLETSQDSNREYECLERCMERLSPANRELILRYYQEEKQAKIDHRRDLARKMEVGANALRIQIHRIRAGLRQCVIECVAAG
jgi:RNA polymerase sigma factor (sigma-70 family)